MLRLRIFDDWVVHGHSTRINTDNTIFSSIFLEKWSCISQLYELRNIKYRTLICIIASLIFITCWSYSTCKLWIKFKQSSTHAVSLVDISLHLNVACREIMVVRQLFTDELRTSNSHGNLRGCWTVYIHQCSV